MLNKANENFILEVLEALKEKKVAATKIFLHKFIYYLTLENFTRKFRFEPYRYGPFSFELAESIESMVFWGQLEYKGDVVESTKKLDLDVSNNIEKLKAFTDNFLHMIENDPVFDNLEKLGTVLYCMEVLIPILDKICHNHPQPGG